MRLDLALVPLALVGCSGGEAREAMAMSIAPKQSVEMAGKATRAEGIAMSWDGQAIRVGDAWESAQKLFLERRSAYQLRTLPERFGNDFEAHGWEMNAGEGYGVVTHDDLLVAAIYHAEDVDQDYAQKLLSAQRAVSGDLPMHEVQSGRSSWTYWENARQRTMVLIDDSTKGTDVTLLMGDDNVLDALGATKPATPSPAVAPFLDKPLTPFDKAP